MGLTFKEDCPDLRNTKVVDIINEFSEFGIKVDVHDPWVNQEEAGKKYGINMVQDLRKQYDGIVFAVAHHQFQEMTVDQVRSLRKGLSVLYDVKNIFPSASVDGGL